MIETFEIPRERWPSFLTLITRRARERPVRLEVEHLQQGSQELGRLLPLLGVELEARVPERGSVLISMAGPRGEALHFRVDHPLHLYLAHDEAGTMEHLAIESADGARILLHFQHPPAIGARQAAGAEQPAHA